MRSPITTALAVTVLVSALSPQSARPATDTTGQYEKALTILADFSERICVSVKQTGSSYEYSASGAAAAELAGLSNKLANVGVNVQGKLSGIIFQGLTQQALSYAMWDQNACRLRVVELMRDTLFPPPPVSERTRGRVTDPVQAVQAKSSATPTHLTPARRTPMANTLPTNDLDSAESPPVPSRFDCYAFNPSPPAAQVAGKAYAYDTLFWLNTASEAELKIKLDRRMEDLSHPLPNDPAPVPDGPLLQHQLRLVLWQLCDLLNGTPLKPMRAFERFEWLTDIYSDRISAAGTPATDQDKSCPPDAPLDRRTVQLWNIWEAFEMALRVSGHDRTSFFSYVIANAQALDVQYHYEAESRQSQLKRVELSALTTGKARCEVLKNGVLNDVSAALWVLGMSLQLTHQDPCPTFAAVKSLSNGLVYDHAHQGSFWRPADTAPTPEECYRSRSATVTGNETMH